MISSYINTNFKNTNDALSAIIDKLIYVNEKIQTYIISAEIPSAISQLENDVGYITSSYVSSYLDENEYIYEQKIPHELIDKVNQLMNE